MYTPQINRPIDSHNQYQPGSFKFSISPKAVQLIASVALAVITATVAYFMLQYGFNRLDVAFTRMDMFIGGIMAYMGTVYAIAAFANAVFTCSQCVTGREYGHEALAGQATVSILAPLAFVPAACFFGLQVAISR